jgi:DNA-binding transcriptional regulator YbjK
VRELYYSTGHQANLAVYYFRDLDDLLNHIDLNSVGMTNVAMRSADLDACDEKLTKVLEKYNMNDISSKSPFTVDEAMNY